LGKTSRSSTVPTIPGMGTYGMSAITATEPGGEMVCIVTFSARARADENRPIPGPRRKFQVGERVSHIATFFTDTPADNPIG
jgi:hypothetical protein